MIQKKLNLITVFYEVTVDGVPVERELKFVRARMNTVTMGFIERRVQLECEARGDVLLRIKSYTADSATFECPEESFAKIATRIK